MEPYLELNLESESDLEPEPDLELDLEPNLGPELDLEWEPDLELVTSVILTLRLCFQILVPPQRIQEHEGCGIHTSLGEGAEVHLIGKV